MGDKKPKKTSSGNSDAHAAKKAQQAANKPAVAPKPGDGKKKKD